MIFKSASLLTWSIREGVCNDVTEEVVKVSAFSLKMVWHDVDGNENEKMNEIFEHQAGK